MKKHGCCFVCESDEHKACACQVPKFKQDKRSTYMVISEAEEGISRYDSLYLMFFPSIIPVTKSTYMCMSRYEVEWRMDIRANIHVCAKTFLFSSYQASVTRCLLLGIDLIHEFLVWV